MRKIFILVVAAIICQTANSKQYWHINKDCKSITWTINKGDAHNDHIEMAGKRVATVLRYGVESNGAFALNQSMVWPMLRTIPNNTHASLMRRFDWNPLSTVNVDGRSITENVTAITLNGTLNVSSIIPFGFKGDNHLTLNRILFPSTEAPALIEIFKFTNDGNSPVMIELPHLNDVITTDEKNGVDGAYTIYLQTSEAKTEKLNPGQSVEMTASISAYKKGEKHYTINGDDELAKRQNNVNQWMDNLVLQSPDSVFNVMQAFSKIRACESIYETKCGPMHGPGGESYYAAIWANDQAEYADPYFPFIGYEYGNASALNSFRLFAKYMNNDYKPIPSSIVAEGTDFWNGAGDRGDCAMIAYGASRYALTKGSKTEAEKLWPLISWCIEYCHRKLNENGVVASDADELEGRFPAGKANLCTSSLYYDALLSAAYLAENLNKGKNIAKTYRAEAATLRKNIDKYFHSKVEGYDTYAYFKGNDILRSWICIPLTVGIEERAKGTTEALFSPRLWTENGLLTQSGDKTFWDRSTLYALRGAFIAGETEKAYTFLKHYSDTRLLGDHVPYAVEAWPEGGQRHLSAESALYGRIYTEGIFGIRPTGFRSFTFSPRLPSEWNNMALRKVRAFNSDFDIEVNRGKGNNISVAVKEKGKTIYKKSIKEGAILNIQL
jgi:hypothetical protein